MSLALLAGIAGLAVLDSFNPATIGAVVLVLLLGQRRPVASALAIALGAMLTVFAVGSAIFLTAGAAAEAVDGIVLGLRFVAFFAAAIALVVAGIRRFRARPRRGIRLPDWFSPWTALPFGAVITAADLPNAFPYFIAIERMIDAGTPLWTGLAVLAGYALIYTVPCLVLLAVGTLARTRVRPRLEALVERMSTGVVPRSVWAGIALIAAGLGVANIPFLL